jgi:hypothetical protein
MAAARHGGDLVAGWSPADEDHTTEIRRRRTARGSARAQSAPDAVTGSRVVTTTPEFAAPGLVLLATIAIYEGYHWLRLIPNGALRPTGLVLAVVVVPATYILTRRVSGTGTGCLRTAARACAVLLPALWIVLFTVHSDAVGDVLGTDSLALALALVALAVLAEAGERQRAATY